MINRFSMKLWQAIQSGAVKLSFDKATGVFNACIPEMGLAEMPDSQSTILLGTTLEIAEELTRYGYTVENQVDIEYHHNRRSISPAVLDEAITRYNSQMSFQPKVIHVSRVTFSGLRRLTDMYEVSKERGIASGLDYYFIGEIIIRVDERLSHDCFILSVQGSDRFGKFPMLCGY